MQHCPFQLISTTPQLSVYKMLFLPVGIDLFIFLQLLLAYLLTMSGERNLKTVSSLLVEVHYDNLSNIKLYLNDKTEIFQ